jgi:hypothetical protein
MFKDDFLPKYLDHLFFYGRQISSHAANSLARLGFIGGSTCSFSLPFASVRSGRRKFGAASDDSEEGFVSRICNNAHSKIV